MHSGLVETLLTALAQHWVLVLTSLTVAWLVKNRYHHGLNKYPGPFLASLTDWWRFWDVYGQRPEVTLQKLHAKHGDIVRLGPNVLSFADPAVLKSIYGLSKGYVKVCHSLGRKDSCLLSSVRLLHCTTIRGQGPPSRISLQHYRQ